MNGTPVVLYDLLDIRQAETGGFSLLGGVEGFEDMFQHFWRDTRAVIFDDEGISFFSEIGGDLYGASLWAGLYGISYYVFDGHYDSLPVSIEKQVHWISIE